MSTSHSIDPKIQFGLRLRELRLIAGLSQEALADRAGLDRTYISSCERGRRNASLEALHKLSGALGVEASSLLETPGSASHGGLSDA
ncbi:helix-turn-helix domain-containing protein [Janthinobacterium sp. P210005]|uniref:helix-turn-helix domain-containing protein n=1 Tax=Janthinobacterium sp. P210005 TaxID=3112938 RepID=UPI002E26891B|nr:helix-turn-helix transcriptional regulator [Janthinobacterium sp. P210005]